MPQAVSLSFFRFSCLPARLWAFGMMGAARRPLSRLPDIGFWKLFGSGTGEGFTPVPNTAVYAILATWPDTGIAQARVDSAPVFRRYRARASEHWTILLTPTSSRGNWSGKAPFLPESRQDSGPLAALTRATIRPARLARFWQRVPRISQGIGRDPNVLFKIGIGEVPWLHQVTFSVWPDADAMAAFARTGPHAAAIKAVRSGNWFHEELYARFAVHSDIGTWQGRSPLTAMETT